MVPSVLVQLATIRDQLDREGETLGAARLQMAIDALEARPTCHPAIIERVRVARPYR